MSTRKELRKEFSDKVLNEELDSEKLVNRYTLWLEQQIIDLLRERKLQQPAVSEQVNEVGMEGHDNGSGCCGSDLAK